MAFKMKGTPMLRNFGVSPLREEEEPVVAKTRVKAEENLVAAANTGNVTVPELDYSIDALPTDKKETGKEKKKNPPKETDKDRNPSYEKKEQRRMNRENRRKARAYRRSQRNK